MAVQQPNSPEFEKNHYALLTQSLDNAPGDFERNTRTVVWLSFVARSKYLMDDDAIREQIVRRIQSLASVERYKDYEYLLRTTCTKLSQKGVNIQFPGCSKPPIAPDLRFLASGSFGCVYKPALPNISANSTTWESYPENVVKLFGSKANMNRAVASAQSVYDELGHNDGHRLTPYKYKSYRKIDLAGKNAPCAVIKTPGLYVARMPDLGKDFKAVIGDAAFKLRLQRVPIVTIGNQVRKILQQLVALSTLKKIHGDVRETNLMIKQDGTITLVDFDWLYPNDDFFQRYYGYLGFYSNPPESLLFRVLEKMYNDRYNVVKQKKILNNINAEITTYADLHKRFAFYELIYGKKRSTQDLKEFLGMNFAHLNSKYHTDAKWETYAFHFFDEMVKTFDGFGFAFSMLELCAALYTPVFGNEHLNDSDKDMLSDDITNNGVPYTAEELTKNYRFLHGMINRVLRPMARWDIARRITPAAALVELDTLLAVLQAPVPSAPMANAGGGGRSRRWRAKRFKETRRRHHRK